MQFGSDVAIQIFPAGKGTSFYTTLNTPTNIGGSGLSCRFVWNTPLSSWDRGKVTGTAGGSTTGLAPRRRRRMPRFCPARTGKWVLPTITADRYRGGIRRKPADSSHVRAGEECTGAATVESALGWCVQGSATSARADDTRQRRQARPLSIMFQYMKGNPYRLRYHMSRRDLAVSINGKDGVCVAV